MSAGGKKWLAPPKESPGPSMDHSIKRGTAEFGRRPMSGERGNFPRRKCIEELGNVLLDVGGSRGDRLAAFDAPQERPARFAAIVVGTEKDVHGGGTVVGGGGPEEVCLLVAVRTGRAPPVPFGLP